LEVVLAQQFPDDQLGLMIVTPKLDLVLISFGRLCGRGQHQLNANRGSNVEQGSLHDRAVVPRPSDTRNAWLLMSAMGGKLPSC
jgi:hypothetical protein